MDTSKKRKASTDAADTSSKKPKGKRQWRAPRRNNGTAVAPSETMEPGDAGIWATCSMKMKGKCTAELLDCFQEYASKLYGASDSDGAAEDSASGAVTEIEADIKREVENMQKSSSEPLFTPVKIDTECLMFFKTRAPIEPVSFVHTICEDASSSPTRKRSRFVKRLTPMTVMGKATEKGLTEVAQQVLFPHFHAPGVSGKKFAIRPTLRNHTTLTREGTIKLVASLVGRTHQVDLKDYDLLILVELYKNVCGMSVVGKDYETLKRFNLAEIYEPTPKPTAG